jgi:hypothetical protein
LAWLAAAFDHSQQTAEADDVLALSPFFLFLGWCFCDTYFVFLAHETLSTFVVSSFFGNSFTHRQHRLVD